MLVFAKKRLVILAMPKTGTTALESALAPMADVVMRDPPNLKHTTAYRYHQHLKPYFEKCGMADMNVLCVLRHPVDWLNSWYRYRQRPAVDGKPHSTKDMSFDHFANEYAKDDPASWAQVGDPARFVRNGKGDLLVDHLVQYEQMDMLVTFLEDRLGTTIDLKQKNVSPKGDVELNRQTYNKLLRKKPQMFEDWDAAKL